MLAMGSGGVEVAMAMAGHPYYLMTPKVWGFYVEGAFEPFVSGKDLILELLRRYTCKAGIGKVMEFFGPGLKNLDMSARATIANMAVDMGFTAGIFPSDKVTRQFLAQSGRAEAWRELKAGPNPQWDELTEIDLHEIEPMVARPHNPDNVVKASELSNVEVRQVIIGSSCNGSYRDLMMAAKIVEGKMRHPNVSFEINTASRQTFDNVLAAGGIMAFLEAGARIHESGCLGCIGMGQAPTTGTASLRTFPRNFKGRSGTRDDRSISGECLGGFRCVPNPLVCRQSEGEATFRVYRTDDGPCDLSNLVLKHDSQNLRIVPGIANASYCEYKVHCAAEACGNEPQRVIIADPAAEESILLSVVCLAN